MITSLFTVFLTQKKCFQNLYIRCALCRSQGISLLACAYHSQGLASIPKTEKETERNINREIERETETETGRRKRETKERKEEERREEKKQTT